MKNFIALAFVLVFGAAKAQATMTCYCAHGNGTGPNGQTGATQYTWVVTPCHGSVHDTCGAALGAQTNGGAPTTPPGPSAPAAHELTGHPEPTNGQASGSALVPGNAGAAPIGCTEHGSAPKLCLDHCKKHAGHFQDGKWSEGNCATKAAPSKDVKAK